jgi:hypothetical protein
MSPTDWYAEAKTWQQGIAAFVGFMALMIAALWNFHLNRRRDAALRDEEAKSVAAALYGEIRHLRGRVAAVARAVANVHIANGTGSHSIKFDEHFVEAYKMPEPTLYKALAPKFGLLPSNLLIPIAAFYENVFAVSAWLPKMGDHPTRGYSYSPLEVLNPAHAAVTKIVPTLKRIERLIDVPAHEAVGPLDLGRADAVIEMEEEWRQSASE